jgi:prevent-host-death family protein
MAMSDTDSMALFDVKNNLSRVVNDVRTTHRRVVITTRGQPAAVLMATQDLESLLLTIETLSDPEAMADVRESRDDAGEVMTQEEAIARWVPSGT